MLEIQNISTGYGKKQVLFDISLEVKQGEIVLIAGSNGSGKSTLLKAIFGLLPLWNNGQVLFNGENITGNSSSILLKKGLLYIPQKNNLFEDLSVKENLEMAGLTLSQTLLQQRIEYVLSTFSGLEQHLNRIPMKMSGGERQLLTLAMASIHQPKVLLIDEPFNGLTPQNLTYNAEHLKLLNTKSGITLIIVEHRVKECLEIATKVISLKLGRTNSIISVNETFNINQLNTVFM